MLVAAIEARRSKAAAKPEGWSVIQPLPIMWMAQYSDGAALA